MSNNPNVQNYDENQIQVLEGLEAVRKRPGMYIGTTSSRGLHHLVYEIVDNSIDEAMAGYCTRIDVTVNPDGSVTVSDNGRGVPSAMHHKMNIPTLEVVFTVDEEIGMEGACFTREENSAAADIRYPADFTESARPS